MIYGPPPLILPPARPAIIRAGVPWQRRLDADLRAKGLSAAVASAVVAEVTRLRNTAGLVRPAGLADIGKWAGLNLAMLPGLFVPISAGAPPVVLTYIGSASSTTTSTTFSFGNFTAPSAGLMIVGASGAGGALLSVSSVSIGGSAATLNVASANQNNAAGIASRIVSSGSQPVSVTFSGSRANAACFVWLITGYNSAIPTSTGVNGATSGTSLSATLSSILSGGVALYVAAHNNTNATSWSAATEDADFAATQRYSGAHKLAAANLMSDVETSSWTSSVTSSGIAAAAWR